MKHYALIVAGGSGTRMNADMPKQFLLLAGKPVLMHTISRFYDADPSAEIIVVLSANETDRWKELCAEYSFDVTHKVAAGGNTRFQSVKNGFELVKEKSVVAVHDGVRPLVSKALIQKCFSEAEKYGSAVPVVPVNESVRKITGNTSEVVDRSSLVLVQTPQCFDSELLKEAYTSEENNLFTDDASVVELSGRTIHLTEGEAMNIKITTPQDMMLAEKIMNLKA